MKSLYLFFSAILGTSLLSAQIVSPLPPIPAPSTALKQYLGLSDTQMQALLDLQKSRAAADQSIYKQINEKQMAINSLLGAGWNDTFQIVQVTLDIYNLLKALPMSAAKSRVPTPPI